MKNAFLIIVLSAISCLPSLLVAEGESVATTESSASPVSDSLRNEGQAALNRAIDWLISQQNTNGYWSNSEFPALTALPLWALVKGGSENKEAIDHAVAYLVSTANADGSFCREPSEKRKGGGLCNYNTALAIVALHAVGNPEHIPLIQKARTYIASSQHFGDDIYKGGMGYDAGTDRPYADLSNSYLAYEAMKLTENVEDLRTATGERADLDWKAAEEFIQRVQNRPESNDQPWASNDPENAGGFAYKPDSSMAGSVTNADGSILLRSYGSMTYAGMLSFIYASVDKNDERVQSAFQWTQNNWTLDENPGMQLQGLYYYYQTLAKALSAMEVDVIQKSDGTTINWRTEMIKKLISLQKIDPATGGGFWVNTEGRWWEADPVLVTSYSLLALTMALQ